MCSGNLLWHGCGQEAAGPPLGFAAAATKMEANTLFLFFVTYLPGKYRRMSGGLCKA
jgi:hypothetical protein